MAATTPAHNALDGSAKVEAVVVGAGAAGLGAAASMRQRRIDTVVLERDGAVGASWRRRYPAVRLNTVRSMSGLPGLDISRSAGRWPTRDAFVEYLERYAAHHEIDVRTDMRVERVDRRPDGSFSLSTSAGLLTARYVVVATGFNHTPYTPDWPGLPGFTQEVIHAARFQDATPFRDRHVLVVGLGNTGSEIAVQLVEGGAASVRVAMRTPPNILRRSNCGLPATVIGRLGEYPPAALHDRFGVLLQRLLWGDLTRYGVGRPPYGIATEIKMKGLGPLVDNGFVEMLKADRVTLVPAVESFDGKHVRLRGGSALAPDRVIVATGYRFGLEPVVGHLGVLCPSGLPQIVDGASHPRAQGLYFNGYWAPLRGQLPAMKRTSRRIARSIARERGRVATPRPTTARDARRPQSARPVDIPVAGSRGDGRWGS